MVIVDLSRSDYSCICCKFQKGGILCVHVPRGLVHLNITDLQEKYFIDRWRPKEQKQIRNTEHSIIKELTGENNQLRYNILSRTFNDLASDGSRDPEKCSMLLLESMQGETSHSKVSTPSKEQNEVTQLKDPQLVKPKGRPTDKYNAGRTKYNVQKD